MSIKKVAYGRWSHVCPLVRFAECMSGGPPLYVGTIDNSIHPPLEDQYLASNL
jgi:hypothetical protein